VSAWQESSSSVRIQSIFESEHLLRFWSNNAIYGSGDRICNVSLFLSLQVGAAVAVLLSSPQACKSVVGTVPLNIHC